MLAVPHRPTVYIAHNTWRFSRFNFNYSKVWGHRFLQLNMEIFYGNTEYFYNRYICTIFTCLLSNYHFICLNNEKMRYQQINDYVAVPVWVQFNSLSKSLLAENVLSLKMKSNSITFSLFPFTLFIGTDHCLYSLICVYFACVIVCLYLLLLIPHDFSQAFHSHSVPQLFLSLYIPERYCTQPATGYIYTVDCSFLLWICLHIDGFTSVRPRRSLLVYPRDTT